MRSFRQIIDLFGYLALADLLGRPIGTVSSWRARDTIPSRFWQQLVFAANQRGLGGVDLATLASLEAERHTVRLKEGAQPTEGVN